MVYKCLTENLLLFKFIHTIFSPHILSTTFPCNLQNKSSTSSASQLFKGIEKQGFQWPLSPIWMQRSATHASFEMARAYKERKETHNAHHHTIYPSETSSSSHYLPQRKTRNENVPFLPDRFPKPNSIPIPNFTRPPPPLHPHIFH